MVLPYRLAVRRTSNGLNRKGRAMAAKKKTTVSSEARRKGPPTKEQAIEGLGERIGPKGRKEAKGIIGKFDAHVIRYALMTDNRNSSLREGQATMSVAQQIDARMQEEFGEKLETMSYGEIMQAHNDTHLAIKQERASARG